MNEAPQQRITPSWHFLPLSTMVLVCLAFFGSQILAILPLAVIIRAAGGNLESALSGKELSTDHQFYYMLFSELITIGMLWFFMRVQSISWAKIGLGRKPQKSDIVPAIKVFVTYFVSLLAVTTIVATAFPSIDVEQEQDLGFQAANTPLALAMVFISLVILPPLVEEIVVRGYLYTGLRARMTKIIAAIVASLFFGFLHLQIQGAEQYALMFFVFSSIALVFSMSRLPQLSAYILIGLAALALVFGIMMLQPSGDIAKPLWIAAIDTTLLSGFLIYLREKTGALWSGMMVHAAKNLIAFLFLFVFVS